MKKRKPSALPRVAMFGHKQVPSRNGGVEVVVTELSRRLAELGCEVTCYNRGERQMSRGKAKDTAGYNGVRLKAVPTVQGRGAAAMSASVFAAIYAAFGAYDVVHIHAEGPAFMCWLPKLLGKRVVVTIHGLDHQRAKWGRLASAYIMAGEKNAVRFADEIVVLSRNAQRYFKDIYGRETVYIPNGVTRPEQRDVSLIRDKFQLEKDSYILFLGRIVPEKGLRYLIRAFRNVCTEKRLVIAGGSSDTDSFFRELQALAETDPRILFTGFVQGRLLEELYSNAYLYVLPSDVEGMPLSLLEAMSYGNCCLVSDIPECIEVVEGHGVTFRQGDAEDLREKLQMLCDDAGSVRNCQTGAADFICGKYGWNEVAERTLRLYRGETQDEDSDG